MSMGSFENIWDAVRKGATGATVEDVRYFIDEKGADVNMKWVGDDSTPLHKACEVIDLSRGEKACCIGNIEFAKILVSAGADVNAKNKYDVYPLHLAALNGNIELAKFLVSNGADVNVYNCDGETPLHWAARIPKDPKILSEFNYDAIGIIKLLVSSGAKVNAKDQNGDTPLDRAKYEENTTIVQYLSSIGGGNNMNYGDLIQQIRSIIKEKGQDAAFNYVNDYIIKNPNSFEGYLVRGAAYESMGKFQKALDDWDKAINVDPNNYDAYFYRGLEYANKGGFDRAIADYDQAIRLNPNDAKCYYNRGTIYASKGESDRAIADYDQAIRLNPNDAAYAYYNRGNEYANKGDSDRAIADYDQAIRLNPNDADIYYNRGVQYAKKGNLDRAIADWETTLRINPNKVNARRNLERARR
jgi:tetratricopeptide (TPR) repeat protein